MSLTSPTTSEAQLYAAIHESWRFRMQEEEFFGTGPSSQLTGNALDRVLLEVNTRHAESVALRRQKAMEDTAAEMIALGYGVTTVDQWALLGIRNDQREVALVTVRAPEAADLRRVDTLRRNLRKTGRRTRGWVVHPIEDVDVERASLVEWLSKNRSVRSTPLMLLKDRFR